MQPWEACPVFNKGEADAMNHFGKTVTQVKYL